MGTLDDLMADYEPVKAAPAASGGSSIDSLMADYEPHNSVPGVPDHFIANTEIGVDQPETWMDYLTGAAATAKQVVPFSDEVTGAGDAAAAYVVNKTSDAGTWLANLFRDEQKAPVHVGTGSFVEDYKKAKAAELLPAQVFREENPIASVLITGAAGMGSLPGSTVVNGVRVPLQLASKTLLGGAAESAATAGAIGTVTGAGTGDTLKERLDNAVTGGLSSAVLAAPFGAVAGRANGVVERVGAAKAAADAADASFGSQIMEALDLQKGLTAHKAETAAAAQQAEAVGLGVLDTGFSPQTAGEDARKAAAAQYAKLVQDRKDAADPLFTAARERQTPISVDADGNAFFGTQKLQELLDSDPAQAIMAKARQFPEFAGLADDHPAMIQEVLRDLGETANNKFSANPADSRRFTSLKKGIEEEASTFNPDLKAARETFAEKSKPIDAFEESYMNQLVNMTDDKIGKAPSKLISLEPERIAATKQAFAEIGAHDQFDKLAKAGFADVIAKRADNETPIGALMGNAKNRAKLQAALTPEEFAQLEQAHKLGKTNKQVSALEDIKIPTREIMEKAKGKEGLFDFIVSTLSPWLRAPINLMRGGEELVAPLVSRSSAGFEKGLGSIAGSVQEKSAPEVFTPDVISAKRLPASDNAVASYTSGGPMARSPVSLDKLEPIRLPSEMDSSTDPVRLDGYALTDILDGLRQVESGGGKYLKSKAGALGPYQFMPATAKDLGLADPMDELASRAAAEKYILWLYNQTGSLDKALAAYNFGIGNVKKGRAYPKETRDYAPKVYAAIKKLKGEA